MPPNLGNELAPEAVRPSVAYLDASRRTVWIAMMLLIILGMILRAAYIGHSTYNPDEPVGQAVVRGLSFPQHWDTNWALHEVPSHFRYDQYNFSSYHYLLFFWQKLLGVAGVTTTLSLEALRALNLLLGFIFLLSLLATARKNMGEYAVLATVAAGAAFPLLVQDAHYVRCEAMLTAGVGVLLWWSLRERHRPPGWSLAAGGFLVGWLVACKATMILASPLLLLPLLPNKQGGPFVWSTLPQCSGFLALGVLAGFASGVPFGLVQPTLYLSGLQHLAMEYSSAMPPYTQPDMAACRWVTLEYLQSTLGWGFWGFTGVGIFGFARSFGLLRLLCVLVPSILAFWLFGNQPFFSERSYSPFIPIACLLFGAGIQLVADLIKQSLKAPRLAVAGAIALLLSLSLAIPANLSFKIVFMGFSGRDDLAQDIAIQQMKGDRQGQEFTILGSNYNQANTHAIAAAVAARESVMILILDANDRASHDAVTNIHTQFGAELLGSRDTLFADLPTCTLHTFISQRLWLLYLPPK